MVVMGKIISENNLNLCEVNYFETCWCKLNTTKPTTCPYLLRYVNSSSNSSYFCVYHTLRKTIDCFNSTLIFLKNDSVSNIYIYLTIFLFIIGIIGNGSSIIILFDKTLRCLNVYRNLTILCALNIFYLLAISIRHINNYNQDLRGISPNVCRWHTFIVTFTGHLCSWQLVSTSIQRVHALLSLQLHRTTSWIQTLCILFVCIILPLSIFDAQIVFNYGLLSKRHMCDEISTSTVKQYQRAHYFPIQNNSNLSKNVNTRYHVNLFQYPNSNVNKCAICLLWNVLDTFIYAIIPFLLILTSSIIIIIKICERRRSIVNIGGICHINQRMISTQDNLSILLIIINCLFLIMTGPFNLYLIIRSILKHFYSKSFSMKILLQLNDYLRLLQNSYHALSFLFYCLIGNKFRRSAWLLCRRIYCKLIKSICRYQQPKSSLILCRSERKHSTSHVPTASASIMDNNKPISNSFHKKDCIIVSSIDKRNKKMDTFV